MGNGTKKETKFFDIKLIKFLGVGILNTIAGYLLTLLFLNIMNLGYWSSTALSYILASIMSYFLNKYFTFKNKEKGLMPLVRFALNIAVCYVLAYGIAQPLVGFIFNISVVESWVGTIISTPFMLSLFKGNLAAFTDNISVLAGMVLFMCFNYVGQRFFAFKEKSE